jgi:hypothetical protein
MIDAGHRLLKTALQHECIILPMKSSFRTKLTVSGNHDGFRAGQPKVFLGNSENDNDAAVPVVVNE